MMIQEDSVLWTHQTFSWGGLEGIAEQSRLVVCCADTFFGVLFYHHAMCRWFIFPEKAMNFTVYTLLPSSVWLSQHVLHWLTCKLRTWMVYSNSICSLVSGIEMGIGKTRLSLPHF